jgi:hypothetical protein
MEGLVLDANTKHVKYMDIKDDVNVVLNFNITIIII